VEDRNNVEVDDTGRGAGLNQPTSLFTESGVCNVQWRLLMFSHVNDGTVKVNFGVDELVIGYGTGNERR
jgi:hypothetical protein